MSYTTSPNMFLRIPTVGADQGPDYATNINYDLLDVLDTHDHTNGRGVQITPAGLNINTDLDFNNHFVSGAAGLTFVAQSITPTLGTIYQSVNDLYYVDGLGNNIRITQSGGVAGTPGSITNLTPPASVNYVSGSQTFVFQSNINTAANIDAGAFIFRNLSPNSTFGVTVEAPAALASNYTLVLPTLPATQKFMTLDNAGTISAPWEVDDSTIKIIANQLVVQGASIPNISREHNWELNGNYAQLSFPLNNIDAIFFAPYNLQIDSVWIYNGDIGTSGTTEYDLKVKNPGGTYASILSTTGKIAIATGGGTITRVSTTATFNFGFAHGFNNGDTVVISGATQTQYNGSFTVFNVTTNTVDYTVSGSPATPATGTPTAILTKNDCYTDSGSVVPGQYGVTKPVIATSNISAGQAIRFDLLSSMVSTATDARIRIYWTQT